jgi:hypothetical protein
MIATDRITISEYRCTLSNHDLLPDAHDFDLPAISETTNDKKLIDKVPTEMSVLSRVKA